MAKVSAMDELTPKERLFVLEYSREANGTKAAREAGYSGTSNSLSVMASKVLSRPRVKKALAEISRPSMVQAKLDVENVRQQLHHFFYRNLMPYLDENGMLTCSLADLPEEVQQCVESVEVHREERFNEDRLLVGFDTRIKLTFVSKSKTAELVMKHLGMLQPDTNVQVNIWQQVEDAARRTLEGKDYTVDQVLGEGEDSNTQQ